MGKDDRGSTNGKIRWICLDVSDPSVSKNLVGTFGSLIGANG